MGDSKWQQGKRETKEQEGGAMGAHIACGVDVGHDGYEEAHPLGEASLRSTHQRRRAVLTHTIQTNTNTHVYIYIKYIDTLQEITHIRVHLTRPRIGQNKWQKPIYHRWMSYFKNNQCRWWSA